MENLAELARTALPGGAKGKPLEMWVQDGARVGRQGALARLWARQGSRPPAPKDCRHAWACIFGAVCPARATGAALVMPYADTDAASARLAEIARHVSPGAHAILVLDGAGRHSSEDLAVPANIALLTLPPYSPELDPVENVPRLRPRRNHLANRVFDTCDAIVDVCCDPRNALVAIPERVASITSRDWAQISRRCRRYGTGAKIAETASGGMTWHGKSIPTERHTAGADRRVTGDVAASRPSDDLRSP